MPRKNSQSPSKLDAFKFRGVVLKKEVWERTQKLPIFNSTWNLF